ncbi:hypothetical protein E1200_31270 [Actinomadura sp. GC306]|uniref:hypothetical protein n=1 Tax=Actinomadura sp. GC306 TaxID=2530367 RepID=UPI00104C2140|nr:hypothetical protein [Actinomadura sp. GC306]TDC59960.1 hypothetical protein E1200_31270 [Actinomadura sp. GC306]
MGGAATMTSALTLDHHGSHRDLLWHPDDTGSAQARIDAIIVPTMRAPAHLAEAARIAALLECPLVTLHSGRYTNARHAARRLPPDTDLIAIDIPGQEALRLPEFKTSRLLKGRFARKTDTSAKRNFALMLSHLMGWERIVFLDDDITVGAPEDFRTAAGLLDTYSAVGLSIGGFPDNSVVCHAYRDVGGDQESFIGGGAMAIEVTRHRSFFPNIYNEDWFYLLDAKAGLRQLAVTGKVVQQPYDPYRTPDRARGEEIGDVLAEGVFWLLDQGRTVAEADLRHWADFIARRGRFIDHVLSLAKVSPRIKDDAERSRMIAALLAARGRLAHITPELCQGFIKALADDQECWQRHVDRLPKDLLIDDALDRLTKFGRSPLVRYISRKEARPSPVTAAGRSGRG